ncbi:Lrp/AsnC family transcriptional regulator [Brevundimonas sp.]|uniref:Lrp/AsnC family transcriptional regulator n=1 Tax=Brevundimonas sp. TaxID=1871086 RepID=UPI002FCA8B6B
MTKPALDELDHRIIETFSRDARVSNRQVASELGVTEGTIRTRLRRLQNSRMIQFTVVTDYRMAGSPNLVLMGIKANPSHVQALAKALSDMPEVGSVVLMMGRYSLLATALITTVEAADQLIRRRIRTLEGVQDVEVSWSIGTPKYDARLARITGPAE